MSIEHIREQHVADDITTIEWTGVPESGTGLDLDISLSAEPIEILPQKPRVPLREITRIERLERKIKDRFEEGIVAVNIETEEVITSVDDSHHLAIEISEVDVNPEHVLIIRVDE